MITSNMGRSEAVSRMAAAHTRMEELGGKHRLSKADEAEFDELRDEFKDLTEYVDKLDRRAEIAKGGRPGSRLKIDRGSLDVDIYPAGDGSLRDTAMRTLDRATSAGRIAARGAEVVEGLLDTGSPMSRGWTARWAVATGDDNYRSAFAKLVADPQRGHLNWTAAEQQAYQAVSQVADEQRAMSLTDNAGGFLVPFELDPAVQISSAGSINPLRQISRVVQTTSDVWHGVTSAGVTASWLAEAAEASDASPTLAGPSIPNYKASAFVPYSYEVGDDGLGFLTELQKLLLDGYEQLSATAFTTGSGNGQPTGIITALAGGGSVVSGDGSEALAASDVFKVMNALPPRFQPNAVWNANLAIINTLRQFETSNGALKFPALQDNPPVLLGRMMYENSNMDGVINAAATEANYLLLYGDFNNYVITDRIGSRIEFIANLVGENQRPTGQRGAFLWARVGADSLVDNAFRVLNVATES